MFCLARGLDFDLFFLLGGGWSGHHLSHHRVFQWSYHCCKCTVCGQEMSFGFSYFEAVVHECICTSISFVLFHLEHCFHVAFIYNVNGASPAVVSSRAIWVSQGTLSSQRRYIMLSLFCGGHGVALCDGFLASISGSEATVLIFYFGSMCSICSSLHSFGWNRAFMVVVVFC